MRKCTNTLKYKATLDGIDTIISIPTYIDAGTASIDANKYYNLANDEIVCNVGYSQLNEIQPITEFDSATRFIINGRAFKTIYVNNITSVALNERGIIMIKLKSDTFRTEDNRVAGISYNVPIIITTPHDYTISATESSKSLQNTRSSQVTVICTKDGEIVISPILTFASSDITICIVNSNGIIQGVSEGSTTINVVYEGGSTIINVTIVAKIEIYNLVGSTSINETVSQQFKININLLLIMKLLLV